MIFKIMFKAKYTYPEAVALTSYNFAAAFSAMK